MSPASVAVVQKGFRPGDLGDSYRAAFLALGHRVVVADLSTDATRGSFEQRAEAYLGQRLAVPRWRTAESVRLVNRIDSLEVPPDIALFIGVNGVTASAMLQLRADHAEIRMAAVMPDPLVYLSHESLDVLRAMDLVLSPIRGLIGALERLGLTATYLPFAADSRFMMPPKPPGGSTVAYAGTWRPYREELLLGLSATFSLLIYGDHAWGARRRPERLRLAYQGPRYAEEYYAIFNDAPVSLNIQDVYGRACLNMRAFEILGAGGCEVTDVLGDGPLRSDVHLLVPERRETLSDTVRKVLDDVGRRQELAQEGYEEVASAHTYEHRAQAILERIV